MKEKMVKNRDVSNLQVKKSRQSPKQRHYRLLTIHYLLLLLLLSLLSSCDLFTGPKVDLFKAISDEVDWANAEKLTVRLNYPSIWGTSNPSQGALTPAMDIRKGYKFNLEFTPESAYTLGSWQVYRTAELDELGNWLENISLIDPKDIEPLGPNEVTLPEPNASGGIFGFTILTSDPVTLIPWCDKRPRITRTEPRDVKLSSQPVSRLSDITLYFNCALDAGTVRLADSETDTGIWITAEDNIKTGKDWYYNPVYAVEDGFFTVTLSPLVGTELPASSLITATVQGIANTQGEIMDKYSFSWNTSADTGVSFKSWKAEYNEKSGNISVSWEQDNANKVVIYYRLNNGVIEPLTVTGENKVTILNVSVPDVSGVRGGRQITGIREYKIFIELYSEAVMESRASFKIWNMPGMAVSDTNPVVEIRTAEELAAIKDNLGGQYVLANDISVTGSWTPIGTDSAPFTGKLYGNGHAITFTVGSSIGGTANHRGLFGYAQGSSASQPLSASQLLSASQPVVIRDFTFEYNASATINASGVNSDFCIGGVVGYLENGTASNIITLGGTFSVTAAGDGAVSLGGIAGYINESFISNCRAGLKVELNRSGGVGNVGAVAGYTNGGSGGNIIINISPPGEPAKNEDVSQLAVDGVTVTANVSGDTSGDILNIGGAVGASLGSTMRDIIVSNQVSFIRTAITESTNVGGVTGLAENSNMEACSFAGNVGGTIDNLNNVYFLLGGLIGCYETNSGNVYINNCLVRGNIKIDEADHDEIKYGSGISIGGVLGMSKYVVPSSDEGIVNITNSFFEEGNITATCSFGSNQAGGFCGSFYESDEEREQTENSHNLNNCGVLAGSISVTAKNYGKFITVGGFTSSIWLKGNTSNCFSRANVISKGRGNNDEEGGGIYTYLHQAGGFAGSLASGSTLSSCYATGNVSAEHSGTRQVSAGGLVASSGGIIENCYALGNVTAEKTDGNESVAAGGLVGMVYKSTSEPTYDGMIQYSFCAGKVITARSNNVAYVGGVVGALWPNEDGVHSKLNNTAALGEKVTFGGGGGWSNIGKISGNTDGNYAHNYVISTMVEESVGSPGNSGANVQITDFISAFWWQNTLGFDPAVWDFSTPAVYRGYPLLKGLSGQQ